MKKLLVVLALGAFASCGNGENKDAAADSAKKDSAMMMAPATDSLNHDSAAMKMDTTATKDTSIKIKK